MKIIIEATSTWSVHWAETGPEKFIVMVQISCLVNGPGGAPAEGATIWGGPNYAVPIFGIVVSGRTLFHLNE